MADGDRRAQRRLDLSRSSRLGGGRRRERLTIYLSGEERELLAARAANSGVSMSKILVDAALHAGSSELIDGATLNEYLRVLTDLQGQVRGMAGNLNQLAHHANTTQNFPRDAADTAKRARRLILEVEDVLESVRR